MLLVSILSRKKLILFIAHEFNDMIFSFPTTLFNSSTIRWYKYQPLKVLP